MIVHMLTGRTGTVVTTKCGQTIDTARPQAATFTGWWHKVTCAECAAAMNLTATERAKLTVR